MAVRREGRLCECRNGRFQVCIQSLLVAVDLLCPLLVVRVAQLPPDGVRRWSMERGSGVWRCEVDRQLCSPGTSSSRRMSLSYSV